MYEAFNAVKAKHGAAGVDGQTLEMFEKDLAGNLYEIWNRMSSGTYFPPPVRAVSIPKKTGGERVLGVPTVNQPNYIMHDFFKSDDAVRRELANLKQSQEEKGLT